ncbi:tatD [Mytilus coruscus]|uniref:TatD n=1 Tax=Mytilus coruscus TaxID=42192 RepID=A0A6J8EUM5_MYTCO|nr:tatD [Mytilus coruscus]
MRNLTAVMKWYPPAQDIYTMYPVNSPAVVMQWRIRITLLALLSPSRRAEFRRIGTNYVLPRRQQSPIKRKADPPKVNPLPPKSYKSSRPTEGRQMPIQSGKAREIISGQPTVATVAKTLSSLQSRLAGKSSTVDAREILNRKRQNSVNSEDKGNKLRRTNPIVKPIEPVFYSQVRWQCLEEYLQQELIPQPEISVEVVGGVIVYCDPDTYPQVLPDTSKWKIAIGLHPKAAQYFNNDQFMAMQEALSDMRVSALGEIGLDRTVNQIHWVSQEKVLDRLLCLARPNKPVILHLRGQVTETMSEEVYTRALEILRSRCEHKQKIHLHCYHGSTTQMDTWRRVFPNTYFSFSLKIKNFHKDQVQAAKKVF